MRLRIINDFQHNAFYNMSLDEALMQLFDDKTFDGILRLYAWKPKAVSIGYFQSIKDEVNLKECSKRKVDVVRRITGGGAVLHDSELTYSFVCSEKLAGKDIIKSYEMICQPIIDSLEKLGLKAEFKPINDIIVNGRKISGNAQTRKEKKVLQHGTVLLKVNVNEMFSLLKVPNEKIKDKLIMSVKQRVTSIENELKKEIDFNELKKVFIKGFSDYFNAELTYLMPSEKELSLAEKLLNEKFASKEWLFMR